MLKAKKYWEQYYPLLISCLLTGLAFIWMYKNEISLLGFINLSDCLGAVITFTSILLGFVGVLLTSIVSIKRESEFVQYFFDRADKKYFKNVVSRNILSGAVLALISIAMFFAPEIETAGYYLQFLWIFYISYFVLTTQRLMDWLLTLLFGAGNKQADINCDSAIGENRQRELEEKYKKIEKEAP